MEELFRSASPDDKPTGTPPEDNFVKELSTAADEQSKETKDDSRPVLVVIPTTLPTSPTLDSSDINSDIVVIDSTSSSRPPVRPSKTAKAQLAIKTFTVGEDGNIQSKSPPTKHLHPLQPTWQPGLEMW